MRLIDADELKNAIMNSDLGEFTGLGYHCKLDALEIVNQSQTIDAKSAKHGKWMYRERTVAKNNVIKECFVNPGGYTVCYVDREMKVVKEPYCSECDWHGKEEFEETPFCPNCGAIMDL